MSVCVMCEREREREGQNDYGNLSFYQNLEHNLINIKNQVGISYYC